MRPPRKKGDGFQAQSSTDVRADARRRSAAGHLKKAAGNALCIEGEMVTLTEVAERLGVGQTTAVRRLARERKKPGQITWGALSK